MSTESTPAMTAEEWANGVRVSGWDDERVYCGESLFPERRTLASPHDITGVDRPHATAAALLYGQPFGFTQEDVKRLEYAATVIECESATDPAIAGLRDFAARIAALLPPP